MLVNLIVDECVDRVGNKKKSCNCCYNSFALPLGLEPRTL